MESSRWPHIFTLLVSCALLAACAGTTAAKFRIANAPVPVPRPVLKPAAPERPQKLAARVPAPRVEVRKIAATEHVVARGETLYAISRATGHPVKKLIALNGLKKPYHLRAGQVLRLPVTQRPEVRVAKAPAPALTATKTKYYAAAGTTSFDWPLYGRILSRFGPKEGGLHNDGINIAALNGEHIRAARDGTVVYAGRSLRSFGNLVLIRHRYGWVTAYAHAEHVLVSKGQRVRRGEIIARAGKSGSVATPQLHFEIRQGRVAVDPERHLPKLLSDVSPAAGQAARQGPG